MVNSKDITNIDVDTMRELKLRDPIGYLKAREQRKEWLQSNMRNLRRNIKVLNSKVYNFKNRVTIRAIHTKCIYIQPGLSLEYRCRFSKKEPYYDERIILNTKNDKS